MGHSAVTTTHDNAPHAEPASTDASAGEHADPTRFTGSGQIPPVATGAPSPAPTSASDRAFGGDLASAIPPGIDLQSVRASIMIPGKRKLAGGYWQGGTVRTREPTQVGAEVTRTGVRVYASPGIYLDADWPLQDCKIEGAGLDFRSKQPYASVDDAHGLGTGMVSIAGHVSQKVTDMIRSAVAGTKLVAGDYDPMRDPDLNGTLNKVLQGFVNLFAENDDKQAQRSPVKPEEMTQVSAGSTFVVREGAKMMQGSSGMTIAAKGALSIDVQGAGNLKGTSHAGTLQNAIDADNVQSVRLETEALEIVVNGKPIARIESVTLQRGGKVTIERMTPLGKLAATEALESGFSKLAALVAMESGDPMTGDLYRNAEHPAVVDGVSRSLIEDEFTQGIHQLILEHRDAVPGIDLARSLGIA